jgi:hypothetical protein
LKTDETEGGDERPIRGREGEGVTGINGRAEQKVVTK